MYPWLPVLQRHLSATAPFIQILLGPRQVGKTTSLTKMAADWPADRFVMSSADDRQVDGVLWIERQWEKARALKQKTQKDVLLILDEIQKIQAWSEKIKKYWDEDIRLKQRLKVVLSGSSSLSIQSGLSESLAGRFEIVPATHLSYPEFKALSGKTVDDYCFYGGYPGALQFIEDESRWRSYISQSIVESILSRDILMLTRVDKPALLRRLFQLGCEFSGQILSYQKMLGQLHESGNTTTLAHYLHLLDQTFVLSGLQKFETRHRKRGSSPKLQVHNTALMGALGGYSKEDAIRSAEIWGRYLESCIGAHLINRQRIEFFDLFYWREGNKEVDFVVKWRNKILAIEVKTQARGKLPGLDEFKKRYPHSRTMIVSAADLESFLESTVEALF